MTLLLIDTNFLIDVERGQSGLDSVIADTDDVAIAAVTLAELSVGVALASGAGRIRRQAFLDDVIDTYPVIVYDESVALQHSRLLVAVRNMGRPRGAHDLMIAATALATGRTIVSADRRAFDELPGVVALDPRQA